ncbi:hypothetical protein PL11_005105 [Lentilactobacillus curieae]|uniref:Arsenical resistance operon trans-acting repressor ArsD n=1 Tax=Lentilactobacillus curieae TaxID=1138822 RepID=A0A1S6QIC1_9LACO|nr:hypothetical protein [Lentilactobacillus curieae]AQW21350.1 hypothetical protein PL11_005105 [Lentilactobacillus curieae]
MQKHQIVYYIDEGYDSPQLQMIQELMGVPNTIGNGQVKPIDSDALREYTRGFTFEVVYCNNHKLENVQNWEVRRILKNAKSCPLPIVEIDDFVVCRGRLLSAGELAQILNGRSFAASHSR